MKSKTCDVYALPEEIIDILKSFSSDVKLFFFQVNRNPFSYVLLDSDESWNQLYDAPDKVKHIFFYFKQPAPASSFNEFRDANPGMAEVDIGVLTETSLGESCISVQTDNLDFFDSSTQLFRSLNKSTKSGLYAATPDGSKEAFYRASRYSLLAKENYDKGIKMIPFAGNSVIRLP